MKLSKKERLSFIYQLRILEALYPEEADHYAKSRTALEEGYSLHYAWLVDHLYDDLTEEQCREVLSILDMYRAITFSLAKLEKSDALNSHHLAKFVGFDGNNETHLMSYARYFIVDLDRFSELKYDEYPYFNSHCPMLGTYRKMLELWSSVGKGYELSREQLAVLLGAEP